MTKIRKWSEQCLVEITFTTQDENGKDVTNKMTRFEFCYSGMGLYRKNFMQDNDKRKILDTTSFDFFVFPDFSCPKGKFYEVEYFLGDGGQVFRALLQVVNPITDIPFVLGVLRANNYLPKDFKAYRAYLRADINEVWPCHCDKDDDGEPNIWAGVQKEDKTAYGEEISIADQYKKVGAISFDYYRGTHLPAELWTPPHYKCDETPVFVCGSENVNDPAFAQQKAEDLQRMEDLLEEAEEIAGDYGLRYLVAFTKTDEKGVGLELSGDKDVLNALMNDETLLKVIGVLQNNKELMAKCMDEAAKKASVKHGWLDECCAHMEEGKEKMIQKAEQGVIGTFLVQNDAIPTSLHMKLMNMIRDRRFSDKRLHQIAIGIIHQWRTKQPADMLSVTSWLEENGFLDDAGGAVFIAKMAEHNVDLPQFMRYMRYLEKNGKKEDF